MSPSSKYFLFYLSNSFEDFISSHPDLENHRSIINSFLAWYDKYESSISGPNTTSEISMKRFPEYLECPGNPLVNWKSGYETIIQYFNVCKPINVCNFHRHYISEFTEFRYDIVE